MLHDKGVNVFYGRPSSAAHSSSKVVSLFATGAFSHRFAATFESIFFSSGMADHALRLGPYMRRSCDQENFNMDTGGHMKHGKS